MSGNAHLIDQQKLAAALISFRTTFFKSLANAASKHRLVATVVPSNSPVEQYKWLGRVPKMREWLGTRVAEKLAAQTFQIVNKDWEATLEVDRDDIRYDKLGMVAPQIMGLAESADRKKDELVFQLLAGGFDGTYGLCYDGQFLFDSDHKAFGAADASQSNVTDAQLDADSLDAGIRAMNEFTDEKGERLDIEPDQIIYGPALRATVRDLLKNERLANGATNPHFGALNPVMSHRITGNEWILQDTSKPVNGVILQEVGGVNFVAKQSPNDEAAFWEKVYYYGIDATFNAGYGAWQTVYGSDGTGS